VSGTQIVYGRKYNQCHERYKAKLLKTTRPHTPTSPLAAQRRRHQKTGHHRTRLSVSCL